MSVNRHSIFREKALKHYTQNKKKDILPDFGSVPAAIFFWVLLGLLVATGAISWYTQVAQYTTGVGVVVQSQEHTQTSGNEIEIVVFFTPGDISNLRAGLPVQLTLGATGQQLVSTISEVRPGLTTPAAVLESYGLQVPDPSQRSQLVVAALVRSGAVAPSVVYSGSAVSVQVKVGTQSLFSSLISI